MIRSLVRIQQKLIRMSEFVDYFRRTERDLVRNVREIVLITDVKTFCTFFLFGVKSCQLCVEFPTCKCFLTIRWMKNRLWFQVWGHLRDDSIWKQFHCICLWNIALNTFCLDMCLLRYWISVFGVCFCPCVSIYLFEK